MDRDDECDNDNDNSKIRTILGYYKMMIMITMIMIRWAAAVYFLWRSRYDNDDVNDNR